MQSEHWPGEFGWQEKWNVNGLFAEGNQSPLRGISGSTEKTMQITITRKTRTTDGIFGTMILDWNPFKCVTMENLSKALEVGTWPLTFAYSPHFNRIMPLINVPHRTWTWIHWANFPIQLDGCVGVGEKIDGDAIDTSVDTWNKLWNIINTQPGILVNITEEYGD